MRVYWFSRDAVGKYHKLGGLKQEKCIILEFWRVEVQNQVVNRVVLSLKSVETNPSSPFSWLLNGCQQFLAFFSLQLQNVNLHSCQSPLALLPVVCIAVSLLLL